MALTILKRIAKNILMRSRLNHLLVRVCRFTIVLGYHRVLDGNGSLLVDRVGAVTPREFAEHLDYFEGIGCRFRPLRDAIEAQSSRAAAITFDDGFQDLHANALPILLGRRAPFTLFLIGSLIDRKDLLWQHELYSALDGVSALEHRALLEGALRKVLGGVEADALAAENPDLLRIIIHELPPSIIREVVRIVAESSKPSTTAQELYLRSDQFDELVRAGADIQPHGQEHWALTSLDDVAMSAEIGDGIRAVGSRFGESPRMFALAHGLGAEREKRELALNGIERIVVGVHGLNGARGNAEVPRIWPRGPAVEVSWMLTKAFLEALLRGRGGRLPAVSGT